MRSPAVPASPSYLLVLDEGGELLEFPNLPPHADVRVLSFEPDHGAVSRLDARLRAAGFSVVTTSAAGLLDDVALRAREEFSRLVAEFPRRFFDQGQPLLRALTFEGRLSLWWLHDLSGKRSDLYPTFGRLCQLEVIRDVVAAGGIIGVGVATSDTGFSSVVEAFCVQAQVAFAHHRTRPRPVNRLRDVAVLRDLAWFARTGLQTLIAKGVVAARPAVRRRRRGAVAFYTQFPGVWQGRDRARDEKYAGVPSLVEKASGIPALLACTFSSDGGHQSASLLNYLRWCRWWLGDRLRQQSVHLTDADLKLTDFVRAAAFLRLHWKFARLVRRHDFSPCWQYRGVDISPLIRREFRTAASRIPRYVLHALRTRRFVEHTQPSCYVTYLFEFCYGRAMLYGAKSAAPDLPVVGVQHGPYARRKLYTHHVAGELPATVEDARNFIEHIPSPDAIVAESASARDLLVASGYRPAATTVGGAPRLGGLLDVPCRTAVRESDRVRVLVVFGQHDAASILSDCVTVMNASHRYAFTFKLHPRSPFTPERVRETLDAAGVHDGYTIARESAYRSLPQADVVLATYSSVALEALARAYPVVCLLVPNRVNPSPLLDSSLPSGVFLTAGGDLHTVLEQAAGTRNDAIGGAEVEYLLGPLDGRVEDRWVDVILAACGRGRLSLNHAVAQS